MCKTESAKAIPARDGTRCYGCGDCYEIMLLVPPKANGGNQRRFTRRYHCDSCDKFFSKYDFGYLFQSVMTCVFGRFTASLPAMRLSGRNSRRARLLASEPGAGEEAPVTKWVKKSQFRSRRITQQKPAQRWSAVANRDFIKVETLMPMHVV